MAAYQNNFTQNQSIEGRSKNPEQSLAFSGTALPSANSKTVKSFQQIFSQEYSVYKSKWETLTPKWVAPTLSDRC